MEEKELIQNFINKNKSLEKSILEYLDNKTDDESNFFFLKQLIETYQIREDKYELKRFLKLISKISNYHHGFNLFSKIERVINIFHESIKNYFSNFEIFNIFRKNKKILLLLFDAQIIIPDSKLFDIINLEDEYKIANYTEYLYPQFKTYADKWNSDYKPLFCVRLIQNDDAEKDPKLFKEKQKIGENDNHICKLIRDDSIEDFVAYINRANISVSSFVHSSNMETNRFLLKNKKQTLIEYAAFFGSIQIFQYLRLNNAELTSSIWLYAIHSGNAKLIHILEENYIEINEEIYDKIINESIKCHYNHITNYIMSRIDYKINDSKIQKSIQCYNYIFMSDKIDYLLNADILFSLCKYDYKPIVDIILKHPNKDIDLNKIYIIKKQVVDSYNDTMSIYKEMTLLYIATLNENEDIVDILLQQPNIDVNCINEESIDDGITDKPFSNYNAALHAAVEHENINILKLLLSHKNIDINIIKEFYHPYYYETKTAFIIAIDNNNVEIAAILFRQPNIKIDTIAEDNSSFSALFYAVENKKPEIVKLILTRNDIDVNIKKVKSYLKDDIYDIRKEMIPLHKAVENKDIETIKYLLSRNDIDVNKKMKIVTKSENIYECIEEKTVLFLAVELEIKEIVDLLLARNDIDVNEISTNNKHFLSDEISNESLTALHLAVKNGNISIIETLLNHKGININAENEEGKKPIEITNDEKIKSVFEHFNQ